MGRTGIQFLSLTAVTLIFSVTIFFAEQGYAAVTYDNAAASTCGVTGGGAACTASNTTLTFSLTVGNNANRALVVFVNTSTNCGNSTPAISTVTYAGVSLTRISQMQMMFCTTNRGEIWILPAGTQPATGANNVVVVAAGAISGFNRSMHAHAISVYNVDQTAPIRDFAYNSQYSSTTATLVLPLSSSSEDLVASAVCNGGSVAAATLTQRSNVTGTAAAACDSSMAGTGAGGTQTINWTVDVDNTIVQAVSFRGVGADCLSPTSPKGKIAYLDPDYYFCDGNAWMSMKVTDTGTGCSDPGKLERSGTQARYCSPTPANWMIASGSQTNGGCSTVGDIGWDDTQKWMQYCNGTNWLAAQSGTSGIAYVTKKENSATASTSTITTGNFGTNPTNGNTMICAIDYNSSVNSVVSVTDTKGNLYSRAVGPQYGTGMNGYMTELWYANNITGGASYNVTSTFTGTFNAWKEILCFEYSGLADDNLLIGTSVGNSVSGIPTTGNVTSTTSQALIFAYISPWGAPGTGSGFNSRSTWDSNQAEDKIITTTGSYNATGANTVEYNMVMGVFRGK